jgi:hypothetical protein
MLNVGDDERAVLARLLAELRELLTSVDDAEGGPVSPVLQRLFPNAYVDDEEKEAEYQRLMREDLVASRLFQIDAVSSMLGLSGDPTDEDRADSKGGRELDEGEVIALMQSVNALRMVLGTLLDIGEEEIEIDDDHEMAAEHQLYAYLSHLLEWIVRSLQGTTPR